MKDLIKLTLTAAKKDVKILTDSQLSRVIDKLNKLREIAIKESDARYSKKIKENEA